MKAEWAPYTLDFRFLAKTSRNSMTVKDTYFVRILDEDSGKCTVGECALFKGLSAEDTPDYEQQLSDACRTFDFSKMNSSILFGFESALMSVQPLEENDFTSGTAGIPINGLIWMGTRETMRERIDKKLADGFHVLKLKIGGINFDEEVELLKYIRSRYSKSVLELRLDANGSFTPENALERLEILSKYDVHSLEQPIRAGQWDSMASICALSPIPIALDEELIGIHSCEEIRTILTLIKPQYIILKPSLCGGFSGANAWIREAEFHGIGWWATSALESNIGLQAIARWLVNIHGTANIDIPQGLGTGMLYSNNITSPLELRGDRLFFDPDKSIQMPELAWRH